MNKNNVTQFSNYDTFFMSTTIPRYVIRNNDLGKYRVAAYIFIKNRMMFNNYVCFKFEEYFQFILVKMNKKNSLCQEAIKSLCNIVDLSVDKNIVSDSITDQPLNYNVGEATDKTIINFYATDSYLDFDEITRMNDYEIGFIPYYLEDILIIRNHAIKIKKKRNRFNDILNIYFYYLSRLLWKVDNTGKMKPIYFYSYDLNIYKDLQISKLVYEKFYPILVDDLKMIHRQSFKAIPIIDEDTGKLYYKNYVNFYYINNNDLEKNIKYAIYNYCKDHNIKPKTLLNREVIKEK